MNAHADDLKNAPPSRLAAHQNLLLAVEQHYILPYTKKLLNEIQTLDKQTTDFCNALEADQNNVQNIEHFQQIQTQWKTTMLAWSATQAINYGPIDDFNLAWKFQFWPDPMNLVHRKLKSRIKGRNKKISAPELAKASVAVQGLSTLEYLLFDEKIGQFTQYQDKQHLCILLKSTTQNLVLNATRISESWTNDYAHKWRTPRPESDPLKHATHQLEKVFSGMVMTLGSIYRDKLGKPLGKKAKPGDQDLSLNPWLLENWRSRHSIQNIKMNLIALEELYLLPESFSDLLLEKQLQKELNRELETQLVKQPKEQTSSRELDREIKEVFKQLIQAFSNIEDNAFSLINQQNTITLEQARQQTKALYDLLKFDYTKTLNIQFRFNAHDGD